MQTASKKPSLPSEDKRWLIVTGTMRRHGFAREALIETLHTVQQYFGYRDKTSLRFVALSLRLLCSREQPFFRRQTPIVLQNSGLQLDPCAQSSGTHHTSPQALLLLAHELYGKSPTRAYCITIIGDSFESYETFSAPVRDAIPRCSDRIKHLWSGVVVEGRLTVSPAQSQ